MGFTTEQKSETKSTLQQNNTNPIKTNHKKINASEFYTFLQELNYKTEIGLE